MYTQPNLDHPPQSLNASKAPWKFTPFLILNEFTFGLNHNYPAPEQQQNACQPEDPQHIKRLRY
jgi:hypothetical protein